MARQADRLVAALLEVAVNARGDRQVGRQDRIDPAHPAKLHVGVVELGRQVGRLPPLEKIRAEAGGDQQGGLARRDRQGEDGAEVKFGHPQAVRTARVEVGGGENEFLEHAIPSVRRPIRVHRRLWGERCRAAERTDAFLAARSDPAWEGAIRRALVDSQLRAIEELGQFRGAVRMRRESPGKRSLRHRRQRNDLCLRGSRANAENHQQSRSPSCRRSHRSLLAQ